MRIGILGSADVGCRLGDGFIELGETVEFESELLTVGSRVVRFILIIHLILTIPILDLLAQSHSTTFEIC
jgi:hypothetical protein